MTNFIEELNKKFDEKFTRVSQGLEDKGQFKEKWFIKDYITAKQLKSFISQELHLFIEKACGEIEDMKHESFDKQELANKYLGKALTQEIVLDLIKVAKINSFNEAIDLSQEKLKNLIK